MDPDYLTVIEYNNQTMWNNQTVIDCHNTTVPVYHNQTIWHNTTNNVTIGVSDADSDGWSDAMEILAGTDPLDPYDLPADEDDNGTPDVLEADIQTTETTKTPVWAYLALLVAIIMGILALMMFMKQRTSTIGEDNGIIEDELKVDEEPDNNFDQEYIDT